MTAVAVQQAGQHPQQQNARPSPHTSNASTPHHSRTQSYTGAIAPNLQPLIQNGSASAMDSRPPVSNDPIQLSNGYSNRATNGEVNGGVNGDSRRSRRHSLSRPTSAPQDTTDQSHDESSSDRTGKRRRPTPLLRSKSDFGPRGDDSQAEEEYQDWGARHGFEDHYASEEYVSELANVSMFHSSHYGRSLQIADYI